MRQFARIAVLSLAIVAAPLALTAQESLGTLDDKVRAHLEDAQHGSAIASAWVCGQADRRTKMRLLDKREMAANARYQELFGRPFRPTELWLTHEASCDNPKAFYPSWRQSNASLKKAEALMDSAPRPPR